MRKRMNYTDILKAYSKRWVVLDSIEYDVNGKAMSAEVLYASDEVELADADNIYDSIPQQYTNDTKLCISYMNAGRLGLNSFMMPESTEISTGIYRFKTALNTTLEEWFLHNPGCPILYDKNNSVNDTLSIIIYAVDNKRCEELSNLDLGNDLEGNTRYAVIQGLYLNDGEVGEID